MQVNEFGYQVALNTSARVYINFARERGHQRIGANFCSRNFALAFTGACFVFKAARAGVLLSSRRNAAQQDANKNKDPK